MGIENKCNRVYERAFDLSFAEYIGHQRREKSHGQVTKSAQYIDNALTSHRASTRSAGLRRPSETWRQDYIRHMRNMRRLHQGKSLSHFRKESIAREFVVIWKTKIKKILLAGFGAIEKSHAVDTQSQDTSKDDLQ